MARVKIKLADNITRVVFVETDATVGSTLGVDFKLPDGSVATVASLASLLGVGADTGETDHRLLAGLTVGDDHPQYTRKDTLTTRGDLYVRGSSTVERFGIGTSNQVLRTDGTDPVWHTFSPVITLGTDLSGSATLTDLASATLNSTIVANAVTDGKLRQSAALSVIGRSANSTGNVADISANADGDVLRRSGTTLGFGNIGANPTAPIGLTAVNGTANTYLRSDGAPALDVSITPTWTATHTFNNTPVVPNASWTYAKIQNVSATSRILGRITAGAGAIEELTGTQATTLLDTFTSALKGLVPLSGGGTSNFLRADGTFAVPAGTTVGANPTASVGLTAVNGTATTYLRSDGAPALDVSISPTWSGTHTFSNTPVVPNTSWTYAKIQNVSATSRFLGRITAGAGSMEELTGTQATSLLNVFTSTLNGLAPLSGGGTTNFLRADGTWAAPGGGGTPASPTASVGLTAVNGSATTYMRSDAAPPIDISISPTWTGSHVFAAVDNPGTIALRRYDGSIASPTQIQSGDVLSQLVLQGYSSTTSAVKSAAVISAAATETWSTGHFGAKVVITSTNTAASSASISLTLQGDQVQHEDGAVGTPSVTFRNDLDCGLYRIGANNIGVGVNGAKVLDVSTTGLGITGTMVASGAISGTNLSSSGGANPSASIGLTAVNGSATTFMRSDAAPALGVTISPTWTGNHTFAPTSGVPITVNATSIAAGTASASLTGHSTIPLVLGDLSAAPNNVLSCYVAISTSSLTGVNGDLVLIPRTSTGASLIVYTGSGGLSAERFRIDGTGVASFQNVVVLKNYTVAGLPSAATVGSGATAFVTDATLGLAAGLGLTPVGGGSNKVPVYSDGTNWKIG